MPGAARTLAAVALLVGIVLAGCISQPDPAAGDEEDPEMPPAGETVRFIAIGDTGTGDENQTAVAQAIVTVCAEMGCDFAIGLGDNIYTHGATSPYDPQFELKFELPYQEIDFPWYMSLGNHDNGGSGQTHTGGDFQVMYSQRDDRMSDKWHMPARWYAHDQGPVQFIAMDTSVLFSGNTQAPVGEALGHDVGGERQMAFLRETMAEPTDGWRILYGHHPLHLFLLGSENERPIDRWLHEAVCETGPVDVHLSGHDHVLRWRRAQPEHCGETEFITSGAGGKTDDPLTQNETRDRFAVGDQLGFFWIEATQDTFRARVYGDEAQVLHEETLRRAPSG